MAGCLDKLSAIAEREQDKGQQVVHIAGSEALQDKANAIMGIKFDKDLPVMRDENKDFDGFLREFESLLALHAYGRQAVRPGDKLMALKQCFPVGTVRRHTLDTYLMECMQSGRWPTHAAAIYDEVVELLRNVIKETEVAADLVSALPGKAPERSVTSGAH